MQNIEVERAIPWNPWHGCKKMSPEGKNCFVYKMDQRYGKNPAGTRKNILINYYL